MLSSRYHCFAKDKLRLSLDPFVIVSCFEKGFRLQLQSPNKLNIQAVPLKISKIHHRQLFL